MQIDQSQIEKAIVEQAVDKLIGDDDLYGRVKRGIDARINALFADKVDGLIADNIEKLTKEGFDRQYCKVDSFGRPSGEPTTISKQLESLLHNYWDQRVDRNGKKADSGSYNTVSRAEWTMSQICADEFSKELKQHVVNVSAALKDHFRGVLNQHIAIMLSDVFKVQSQGDRDLNKPGASCISPPAKPIGL